jgi:glucose/arabinose dehydrogenase
VHRPLALLVLLAAGAAAAADARVQRVAVGLESPLYATSPPGDAERIFVLEKVTGRIRIVLPASKTIQEPPFLDLENLFTGSESGLLGLAFHPDYAENGVFFVHYNDLGGDSIVARYTVSANPQVADPQSFFPVLRVDQPQGEGNHKGGWLGFGPDDGYLYIGFGDGGGGYDDHGPIGNGQDPTTLLGKLLRIDVDGADAFPADPELNYAIPPDNPFVGEAGIVPEIWALGLRNPWRASFDRETGDLWIGDVGQDTREEIDFQPAGSTGGENYGWRLREGTIETPTVGGPKPPGNVDPIHDYPHPPGNCSGSVTGGYVYRGPIAAFQGLYFFSDFCISRIQSLRFDGSDPSQFDGTNFTDYTDWTGTPEFTPDAGTIDAVASFGEDGAGNLYVVDHFGELFRVPEPAGPLPTALALASAALLARRIPRKGPPRFW